MFSPSRSNGRLDEGLVVRIQASPKGIEDAVVIPEDKVPARYQRFGFADYEERPFSVVLDGRFAKINDSFWCDSVVEKAIVAIEEFEKKKKDKGQREALEEAAREDAEIESWET